MKTTNTTDQVLARRRTLLLSFLVGWCAWYGMVVLQETGLQSSFPPAINVFLGFVGMAGAIVYTVSTLKMISIRKKYRDDAAALAALTDELQSRNRGRAIQVGFFALLLVQAPLILFGESLSWSVVAGAQVSILVGVAAALSAAIWLDFKE